MSAIELITAAELERDADWWRIYEASFPADEREPPEVVLESIRRQVGMAFRVRRQTSTFGLATIHLLIDPPAVFLVYLAVAADDRSQGTGGELLESAWEMGANRLSVQGLQPLGLIWEVDGPQSVGVDAETRRRRIAFFRRHGGELLTRPYLQPPVNGIAPVPMRLMFRPAEGTRSLLPETLEGLVRAIYFEKYGAINKIDSAILERLLLER